MAYNTKAIKVDVNQKPIPQIYNPVTDEYEVLQGANGAARHTLYGPDGQPITTDGNKLAVRATEIETQLTTIQGYIDGIEGTLATLATASNQAAIAGYIDQVEAQLTTIQGYIDGLEGAIGQAVADPAVNTLLARVKNLETKLVAIVTDGVKLSGSKTQQILTRGVRASGVHIFTVLDLPVGCKGIHVMIRIHGVTGTFVSEGLTLTTRPMIAEGVMANIQLSSPKITTATSYDQIWQKGGVKGDITYARAGYQIAGVVPGNRLTGELNITGTFTDGQGFDCEVWAVCMV